MVSCSCVWTISGMYFVVENLNGGMRACISSDNWRGTFNTLVRISSDELMFSMSAYFLAWDNGVFWERLVRTKYILQQSIF